MHAWSRVSTLVSEVIMDGRAARRWIWGSLIVQCVGYVFDALWHGVLDPGVEPTTMSEMARHLGTVHLPLYIGAAGVLVSTFGALLRQIRRPGPDIARSVACAGAVLSAGAEGWHASSHLRLDTHTAPLAGILSVVGFIAVVAAMSLSSARRHGRTADAPDERR